MHYQYNLGLGFYNIAEKHQSKTALRYPDGASYSYAEINQLSNQIARFLIQNNLSAGDVVAIFNEKSVFAYSLMLACLKTGIIYTNLDVSSPWARIEKILNTCLPKAVFFDREESETIGAFKKSFSKTPVFVLEHDDIKSKISALNKDNFQETSVVHGSTPAYIMFTSGSTGFPKGAVMTHNNVLNFIQWGKQTFDVTPEDVFTNANPIYFDNSVFDFYTSLYNGATLVPLSHELVKNARQLVQAINQSACTIWFSVPSLLVYLLTTKALSKNDFPSIKRISFGGEGFPKNKLKQLYDMFNDRITLYNVYGPTECTCICSSYIINAADFDNMNELAPLGNIAPNFGYEIIPIDAENENFGELALIGPCVGAGYYNDFERTSKSFVQNPKSKYNQLMYKTGDVVEKGSNGYLYFRGRIDNQIKHMGYRIELEEVEAAFSTLDYVDEIGVVYEKISAELGQIKAFVSLADKNKDTATLMADIKKLLPPYMVPRNITILDVLPKNANGKIDRKQLSNL
ncbi:D-alanine--poly(phosphoribitol) ligase [Niastella caeni]|uniref:D-alanine--poly(Phosphoribitol) ligase n=1 Tax=Niastella caeni TaxID=2569763 RepID=A0A4S8I095_9BACT|nr:AMP-binding protein [Niastella caeni]THU41538.1 D-alanine--poly(phosphoribitol) ligase [Niastella caeni]